jgi:hypothetical protein
VCIIASGYTSTEAVSGQFWAKTVRHFLTLGLFSLGVMAQTPAQALTDPIGPRVVANPMAVYYPPKARKAKIDGVVVVACTARVNARFDGCRIVREMPQGFGFGAATLKMVAEIGQADLRVNKPGDEVQATIKWHYTPER